DEVGERLHALGAAERVAVAVLEHPAVLREEVQPDRLQVVLGVEAPHRDVVGVEALLGRRDARGVGRQLLQRRQQRVLVGVGAPRERRRVDAGLVEQRLVVEQRDRVAQLRHAPERPVALVELDGGRVPLVVVLAQHLGDVEEVARVGVAAEVGGVGPEDVGHLAGLQVQRQLLPVVRPGHLLDLDADLRVLLGERGERLLVRGGRGLVPEPERHGRDALVVGAATATAAAARGARGQRECSGDGDDRCETASATCAHDLDPPSGGPVPWSTVVAAAHAVVPGAGVVSHRRRRRRIGETGPMTFTTRPELTGTFGMVASTHWLASAAGMAVLEAGGNAYDAAVATGLVLHVVEPHLNGVAGEVPVIAHDAASGRSFVVCGQGVAPQAATIEAFEQRGITEIPGAGLLAATVPGSWGAWMHLLGRYGTLELRDVARYAIGYARDGYPLLPTAAATIRTLEPTFREHWHGSAALYLPDGDAPAPGTRFRNPALADTLERLVAEGE